MDLSRLWLQRNQTKNPTLKNTKKKKGFINKLKYAEQKIFCICVDVYKMMVTIIIKYLKFYQH